jgi:hypothetical protein
VIIRCERGIALIMMTGLLLLISLLGISSFRWSIDELEISANDSAWVESLYLAESGIVLVNEWFQDPGLFPGRGTYPAGFSGGGGPDFFRKRRTDARGASSFLDGNGVSQFTGTPEKPDWQYETGDGQDELLGNDFNDLGRLEMLKVFAPVLSGGVCTVEATGISNSGLRRSVSVQLVPGAVPAFLSALQTGNGAVHPIPVEVHWGDVRVRREADLGGSLEALPVKDSAAAIDGADYAAGVRRDGWLDFYSGREVVNPVSFGCVGCDQPFLHEGHANVFQNQERYEPVFALDEWDYRRVKSLAREAGAYFGSDPSGNLYRDGVRDASHRTTLGQFLSANGRAGGRNLVFIDTVDGQPPDGTNLAELIWPAGYNRGLFFINADLVLEAASGGGTREVLSPPREGTADESTRRSVRLSGIHVDGVLAVAGRITALGHTRIFGSVSAVNGFAGSGKPEVWYDADLRSGTFSGLPVVAPFKGSWSVR